MPETITGNLLNALSFIALLNNLFQLTLEIIRLVRLIIVSLKRAKSLAKTTFQY